MHLLKLEKKTLKLFENPFKTCFPNDSKDRQGNKSSNCFRKQGQTIFTPKSSNWVGCDFECIECSKIQKMMKNKQKQNLQTGSDVTVNVMNAPNQSTLQVQDHPILIIRIHLIHKNKYRLGRKFSQNNLKNYDLFLIFLCCSDNMIYTWCNLI